MLKGRSVRGHLYLVSMSDRSRAPLFTYVARAGLFAQNGEPAVTACLKLLLQFEPRLRSATVEWLSARTGLDVRSVQTFESQTVHSDLGRPDLEGWDKSKRPVLVVEAKFRHELTKEQFASYLTDQRARLLGDRGALVALVPASRTDHAIQVLAEAQAMTDAGDTATAVVTWDEWLDCWDDALGDEPAGAGRDDFMLRSDLNQLRGLVKAMDGLLGQPYVADPNADWREGLNSLKSIVDEATIEVNAELGFTAVNFPAQTKDPSMHARYVIVADRGAGQSPFMLAGLFYERAAAGRPPVWARLDNERAQPVIGALYQAFPEGEEDDRGHFWVPLELPNSVGPEVTKRVADQLRAMRAQLDAML